jgi:hypothetical protein
MITPINSAIEKLRSTSPPMMASVPTTSSTVMEVQIVRASTSLTDRLMALTNSDLPRYFLRFSRMRSNTTTVSVREYPARVSSAVMISRSNSNPSRYVMPSTASTSWSPTVRPPDEIEANPDV